MRDLPALPDDSLLALDLALRDLENVEPAAARVVELRFFGGLTNAEAAEQLDISIPTVVRRWRFARAWLFRNLEAEGADGL